MYVFVYWFGCIEIVLGEYNWVIEVEEGWFFEVIVGFIFEEDEIV